MPAYVTRREKQVGKENLLRGLAGPLRAFLPDSLVLSLGGAVARSAAFPPLVMVWCMIRQAIAPDPSCRATLAWLQTARAAADLPPLSSDTGGYCKARQRFPNKLLPGLAKRIAMELTRKAKTKDLWCGRRVLVADGSSFSMPDTVENQAAYPQPCSQKPGCGFPIAGFVSILCLATGALLDAYITACDMHDLMMFSFVRGCFAVGDIFLGDRGFASYAEMALFKRRGVDSVLRLHQSRKTDFRRGRILGFGDHVVAWNKPTRHPKSVSKAEWNLLPDTLEVRELRYRATVKGYRTREITLSTTLLDAEAYPAGKLAELYFRRWEIEVDYRHIKDTMQMDVLRGRRPDMVEREFWAHLLAYNLLRRLMWEAGILGSTQALMLSLKGTIQHLLARWGAFGRKLGRQALDELLALVSLEVIPYRPERIEPRVKKRRPKDYALMTKPRSMLKEMLPLHYC